MADVDDDEFDDEAHIFDPGLVALGLRLLIAAIEDDPGAFQVAMDELNDHCDECERQVWLSVLMTAGHYGTEAFAELLRRDLLDALDAAELARESE